MREMTVQGVGLALMLLAFPLLSWSTTEGLTALSAVGIALVAVGGLPAPVFRFISLDEDDDGDANDDENDEQEARR